MNELYISHWCIMWYVNCILLHLFFEKRKMKEGLKEGREGGTKGGRQERRD